MAPGGDGWRDREDGYKRGVWYGNGATIQEEGCMEEDILALPQWVQSSVWLLKEQSVQYCVVTQELTSELRCNKILHLLYIVTLHHKLYVVACTREGTIESHAEVLHNFFLTCKPVLEIY